MAFAGRRAHLTRAFDLSLEMARGNRDRKVQERQNKEIAANLEEAKGESEKAIHELVQSVQRRALADEEEFRQRVAREKREDKRELQFLLRNKEELEAKVGALEEMAGRLEYEKKKEAQNVAELLQSEEEARNFVARVRAENQSLQKNLTESKRENLQLEEEVRLAQASLQAKEDAAERLKTRIRALELENQRLVEFIRTQKASHAEELAESEAKQKGRQAKQKAALQEQITAKVGSALTDIEQILKALPTIYEQQKEEIRLTLQFLTEELSVSRRGAVSLSTRTF